MLKEKTTEIYRCRILQVVWQISSQLDQPLDIELLAKEAAFSLFHFQRIYRSVTGETLSETHRRLRFERAAGLLVHSKRSITDIALDIGYETPQAFSKAFKLNFHLTPSAYRQKGVYSQNDKQSIFFPVIVEMLNMQVKIEQLSPELVYGMHHVGSYHSIGATFTKVWEWVIKNNIQVTKGMAIYYNDPAVTPAVDCHSDVCIAINGELPESLKDHKEIKPITIAGGKYACYRHIGPYSTLEQTYMALYGQWLPSSGYECADLPAFENYLNGPHDTPESELITDIYIPLKD